MALVLKNPPANAGDAVQEETQVRALGQEGRRAWQPTPVPLPGESHGQRSLEGYSPWGCPGWNGLCDDINVKEIQIEGIYV